MPNESGAVSRIGPATWVTASATTSCAASRSARMLAARAIIGLADVGRLGAARGAGEQPRAELLLEPRDAAGEDRLGQAHPLGGAGEGAGLDHPDEGEDVDRSIDERSIFRNTIMPDDGLSGNAASAPISPPASSSEGE